MKCEQFSARLSAWLAGELSSEEGASMRRHLEQCPRCKAVYRVEQSISTGLNELAKERAPRGFSLRLYAHLFAGEVKTAVQGLRALLRGPLYIRAAVSVAAAVAVIFLVLEKPWQPSGTNRIALSAREVQRGVEEARFALSFVLYGTKKSQQLVAKKTLPEDVVSPLQEGVRKALQSLKLGGKS